MKKTKITLAATALLLTGISAYAADSISITNTFGGDTDKLSGKDFFVTDKDFNKEDLHISDRIQFDAATQYIDSRIRLDINASESLKGTTPDFQLQGYVNVKPVEWLNIIGGNKFFSKHAIPAAYLAANDNYTAAGKLVDDNGAGIVFSKWGVNAGAAIGYESDWNVNLGVSYILKDIFSAGFTAQNITDQDQASFSVFTSLLTVKDLHLTAGYSYNFSGGILSNTKHELQFSTGYKLTDIGLSFYLDGLFGLTDEYYNSKSKANDVYRTADGKGFAPFHITLLSTYKATKNLLVGTKLSAVQSLKDNDRLTSFTAFPYIEYSTPAGTFRTGTRFGFDDKTGYKSLSIPFSWIYKFGVKK